MTEKIIPHFLFTCIFDVQNFDGIQIEFRFAFPQVDKNLQIDKFF